MLRREGGVVRKVAWETRQGPEPGSGCPQGPRPGPSFWRSDPGWGVHLPHCGHVQSRDGRGRFLLSVRLRAPSFPVSRLRGWGFGCLQQPCAGTRVRAPLAGCGAGPSRAVGRAPRGAAAGGSKRRPPGPTLPRLGSEPREPTEPRPLFELIY